MQVQPKQMPTDQAYPLRCSGVRDGRRCLRLLALCSFGSGHVTIKCHCCGYVNVFRSVALKPSPA